MISRTRGRVQGSNGDNRPDLDTLEKLAVFYSVSSDYLIGLTDKWEANR